MIKPQPCIDCGPDAVFHTPQYVSAFLTHTLRSLDGSANFLSTHTSRITRPLSGKGESFLNLLEKMRLGKFTYAPSNKDSGRAEVLWNEATRRGIQMKEFHLLGMRGEIFVASWSGKTIVFEGLPRPRGEQVRFVHWMDNKDIMRKKFSDARIPIAQGGVVASLKDAKNLFASLEKPVITKPHMGSRSRHTTTHIATEEQLERGFKKAKRISPWVIIEEELLGPVHRGTVIDSKLVAVLRRDQPTVVGDGVATVQKLVEKENEDPRRHGHAFHEIPIDADSTEEISRQGMHWESVPSKGTVVYLHQKVGRGQGAVNTDVTECTHPDNKKMLEDAAKIVADPLIGFDFIMGDVEKSWKDQKKAGIIECNSVPFIDIHHYPFNGKPQNVAGALWDLIFPGSKNVSL